MKVKEFIKILKKVNPEADVLVSYIEDGYQEVSSDIYKIDTESSNSYVDLFTYIK